MIFFFTGTAFDVVPYEIITYVLNPAVFLGLRTDQFVCPIYSTPFDVGYVPYEIIQSNSQLKKAHQ